MPTTIAHLIGQLGRGGAERQLIHLARQLAMRGWEQTVISFGGGDSWRHQLDAIDIAVHEIPRHLFKPWRLWQLVRILRKERPAILQTWSSHVAQYARWANRKNGARMLYGVRNDPTVDGRTGDPVSRLRFPNALIHADCVVSNSQSALDNLCRFGVTLPRVQVILNIVESHGRANAADPTSTPRIVAVGSLIQLKGYDCLLRAAAILAAEQRTFQLFLAGEGAERGALESLASEMKLEHCVHFMGAVDNIGELLATSHMLVHPSKCEGLSNTILEGMAEGLPVISTWECASEIIEDGRTGILVPAGQPALLADAMRRLLDSSSLRNQLGTASFHYVEKTCNPETITTHYENVYRSLLSSSPSPASK